MRLSTPARSLFLAAAILVPAFAVMQTKSAVTFPDGVVLEEDATAREVLETSDNFHKGILTVGERRYAFDAHDHLVIAPPEGLLELNETAASRTSNRQSEG